MRLFLLSVLTAFAVFLTAPSAHAQGGHCLNHPLAPAAPSLLSHDLSGEAKALVKPTPWLASPVERAGAGVEHRARPAEPLQSRAPVLCDDPNDPRCRIDMPDAPRHHAAGAHACDAARASELFEGIPPADEIPCADTPHRSGPRAAHAPGSWRPPSR